MLFRSFLEWVADVAEAQASLTPDWVWPIVVVVALLSAGVGVSRWRTDRIGAVISVVGGLIVAGAAVAGMSGPRSFGVYNAAGVGLVVTVGMLLVMVGVGGRIADEMTARRGWR